MAQKKFSGKYSTGKHEITVEVGVLIWEDAGIHYAYAPSLDLTGYGESEADAQKSFEHTLKEFVDYTNKKKTIYDELEKLGWTVNKRKKRVHAPDYFEMLEDNETLKELSSRPDIRTSKRQLALPV